MTVDSTELKSRFQSLACLDDDVVDRWLAEAARNLNVVQWGGKYDDAHAYLTAHLIATFEWSRLGTGQPGSGPIVSEKEDRVSVTLGAPAKIFSKDSLGGTVYGRRYRELLATIFVTRCV